VRTTDRRDGVVSPKLQGLIPTRADLRQVMPAILRGTGLGALLGILPGGGSLLATFAAYAVEKKIKARPGEIPMGKGNIRGVGAPESANNAAAQTAFIPMLTLGLPSTPTMALMIGAMTLYNIQPGPQVITSNPELFWGLIVSMWFGNAMLVILNLPLIGIWVRLLTIPYKWLFPSIVLFCAIGAYSTGNNVWDVWMVAVFGAIGYAFVKLGCEPAPLALGLILGPMLEENLRRSLLISRGDWSVFLTHPLSAVLLAIAAFLLVIVLLPAVGRRREKVLAEVE
jgi:putative tricarboxylic transport membrane protein